MFNLRPRLVLQTFPLGPTLKPFPILFSSQLNHCDEGSDRNMRYTTSHRIENVITPRYGPSQVVQGYTLCSQRRAFVW